MDNLLVGGVCPTGYNSEVVLGPVHSLRSWPPKIILLVYTFIFAGRDGVLWACAALLYSSTEPFTCGFCGITNIIHKAMNTLILLLLFGWVPRPSKIGGGEGLVNAVCACT